MILGKFKVLWSIAGRPIFICAIVAVLIFAGCERKASTVSASGRVKAKVAWIGLVCEAPLFAAYENGYFTDEGLDVEMVKTDWDSFQSGMSFNRFDATHTLVSYLVKPIEQGLDVKMTGGVHKGCLRIQAGIKTDIHRVEDLKGKRIAVSTMGNPPMIFASRVLAAHGVDIQKDVTWVVYPADSTELALNKGRVDAVADSEPIGSLLLSNGAVRTVVDQMIDMPYADEFCCAVVVSGPLIRRDPATAAKLTRAILRGSKWVGMNPRAAARIEVEKRYISKANIDLNAAILTKLKSTPGVETCRLGIGVQTREMKSATMLRQSTDPDELAGRIWQSLDGVTDEWIQNVPVQKIDGAGPVVFGPADLAALLGGRNACCNKCCLGD
jgi:NitT/TauT family transport system substrate-binding protein